MGVTSIRLQDDLEKSLSELAEKSNRSKNWLINQAIKAYIEHLALEEERWLETLPALDSVKSGKSVPAAEVELWLSSWGKPDERQPPEK
ncbi:MAG: ribbon-helix-helix protein, CopG family [Pseudomonadota bacterium]|nr:ribbon-helix-helix protein, CopG family [Pseudomonadota bacterium]